MVALAPEGQGWPGYEAKKGEAPDQASAEGPATPPAKGGRAPNVVERVGRMGFALFILHRQEGWRLCFLPEWLAACEGVLRHL